MKQLYVTIIALIFNALLTTSALAEDDNIMMARTQQEFKVALDDIMKEIENQGYTVAHVQRCDGGMEAMGYQTDNYKVVFFGKLSEVRELSQKHENLIPYFPFKAIVYKEGDETVLSILNPKHMQSLAPDDPALSEKVKQWKQDFDQILERSST